MSIANNTVNLSEIMTTASDGEGVLGKIVFYGLGGIMIDREEFERLRAACQFSAPTVSSSMFMSQRASLYSSREQPFSLTVDTRQSISSPCRARNTIILLPPFPEK